MSKIIFLDIDGPVIPLKNIAALWRDEEKPARYKVFGIADEFLKSASIERDSLQSSDPYAVLMITQLAELTDAKIVISSVWRKSSRDKESFAPVFQKLGFDPSLLHDDWRTPIFSDDSPRQRQNEIESWLESHPDTTHFITIDDEPLDFETHVQVCGENGFLHRNFNQALEFLGHAKDRVNLDQYWIATVGYHGPAENLNIYPDLKNVVRRLNNIRDNDKRDFPLQI